MGVNIRTLPRTPQNRLLLELARNVQQSLKGFIMLAAAQAVAQQEPVDLSAKNLLNNNNNNNNNHHHPKKVVAEDPAADAIDLSVKKQSPLMAGMPVSGLNSSTSPATAGLALLPLELPQGPSTAFDLL